MSLYGYTTTNVSQHVSALLELTRQLTSAEEPLDAETCIELRKLLNEADNALENHELSHRVGPLVEEAKAVVRGGRPTQWPLPVLLHVRAAWVPPAGCNITSRLGDIVSCSLTEDAYEACRKDHFVLSIEESRAAACR